MAYLPPEIQNALNQVEQFERRFAKYPGAAPGGTGRTGLNRNDAVGYSKLLEQKQEYLRLRALLEGKAPPTVEFGYGSAGSSRSRKMHQASGQALHALRPRQDQFRVER